MMEQSVTHKSFHFSPTNIGALLLSSSVITKATVALLLVFYLCSYSTTFFVHFCVIPGYVLPPSFWVWTLLTHNFIQSHIVLVIVDACVVILTGKLLEPLWGPLQLGLFSLVVTTSAALLTSITYMFIYYVTGNTSYLFETYIHGLGAYTGGFCVAVKQLMPDQTLLALPIGKIQNRHIPLITLVLATSLAVVGLLGGSYPIHFGFGVLVSWTYLRFYQRHSNGSRGDMAEDFTFSSFFPPPLEIPVAILSNTIFSLLIRIKVCKKPQRKYDVSSPTTITVTLPGTDPVDAERRRQLAIKALNERLNRTNDESNWPGFEGDNDDDDGGGGGGGDEEDIPDVIVTETHSATVSTNGQSKQEGNSAEVSQKAEAENPS